MGSWSRGFLCSPPFTSLYFQGRNSRDLQHLFKWQIQVLLVWGAAGPSLAVLQYLSDFSWHSSPQALRHLSDEDMPGHLELLYVRWQGNRSSRSLLYFPILHLQVSPPELSLSTQILPGNGHLSHNHSTLKVWGKRELMMVNWTLVWVLKISVSAWTTE